jgi:hypothetical protein
VEDALLSPVGFAVLSGAGLMEAGAGDNAIQVHTTVETEIVNAGTEGTPDYQVQIKGSDLGLDTIEAATIYATAETPIYGTVIDASGAVVEILGAAEVPSGLELAGASSTIPLTFDTDYVFGAGDVVRLDFYVTKTGGVTQLDIDAENFAGYYYVEAATLFRDQTTGQDFPAEFVLPKVKIQSNFTFTMAASGDPSTFTFTMDAFPGRTPFDNKKVLCAIQMITGDVAVG